MLPFGAKPICDFDGTIAHLAVQWDAIRTQLGVGSLEDLWHDPDSASRWATVTDAEIGAVPHSRPIGEAVAALSDCEAFAVLTNNHEAAVHLLLSGVPALRSTRYAVLGRGALGGSKRNFTLFASAYRWCCCWLNVTPADATYVGDSAYELDYAARLGARVIDMRSYL